MLDWSKSTKIRLLKCVSLSSKRNPKATLILNLSISVVRVYHLSQYSECKEIPQQNIHWVTGILLLITKHCFLDSSGPTEQMLQFPCSRRHMKHPKLSRTATDTELMKHLMTNPNPLRGPDGEAGYWQISVCLKIHVTHTCSPGKHFFSQFNKFRILIMWNKAQVLILIVVLDVKTQVS